MLGVLLLIGEQRLFVRHVLLRGLAARALRRREQTGTQGAVVIHQARDAVAAELAACGDKFKPVDLCLKPVEADVLVTGADADAKARVSALAEQIEGARAVDAGPLRFSRFVEGLTVLLIGINGRYKAHTGVRVQGLPPAEARP